MSSKGLFVIQPQRAAFRNTCFASLILFDTVAGAKRLLFVVRFLQVPCVSFEIALRQLSASSGVISVMGFCGP